MKIDLEELGYDRIAAQYLDHRRGLKTDKYIHQLLKYLPKRSTVLDLGCGAGVPVDDRLIKAGHYVIGIDNSPQQIKLARQYCPGGEHIVGDMNELRVGEYQAQAVVAMYALFHIPRSKHQELLNTMASYLPKGGMLLITMGDREFEGEYLLLGARLLGSQYGTAKNRAMIEKAGLKTIRDEIDTSGGERHQVVLAQKVH